MAWRAVAWRGVAWPCCATLGVVQGVPTQIITKKFKMSTLAFNVRAMQAKVGVSIAKDLNVELTDKILDCSTLLNARELVSCLEDLSFVGRVGASNA